MGYKDKISLLVLATILFVLCTWCMVYGAWCMLSAMIDQRRAFHQTSPFALACHASCDGAGYRSIDLRSRDGSPDSDSSSPTSSLSRAMLRIHHNSKLIVHLCVGGIVEIIDVSCRIVLMLLSDDVFYFCCDLGWGVW